MAGERTPRTKTTREEESRPTDSWVPASILPNPDPRDGWVHRWIRTSVLGESDNTNVSKMMREGWQPVKAEDYPELLLESDIGTNTFKTWPKIRCNLWTTTSCVKMILVCRL